MKDKKSLYLIATGIGLITTIAIAVFSTSNTSLFKSLAGGIVHTSDKGRTLTLDNTTPLEIDGEGKGNVSVGNISAFSPNCSSATNGIANIGNNGIVIYCNNAAKEGTYYKGFGGSKIDSLILTFNGGPVSSTVYVMWGKTDGETITGYGTSIYNSAAVSSNTLNQEFIFEYNSKAVLKYQDTPKTAGYSCLYIYVNDTGETVDLVSLEVQYTCN